MPSGPNATHMMSCSTPFLPKTPFLAHSLLSWLESFASRSSEAGSSTPSWLGVGLGLGLGLWLGLGVGLGFGFG